MTTMLRRFLGRLRRTRPATAPAPAPIWEGVYPRLCDVPARGEGFAGNTWLEMTRAYTRGALEASTGLLPEPAGEEHTWLVALVATLLAGKENLRVLDFGGGMGISYAALRAGVVRSDRIDYHVVEGPEVCDAGRALFGAEAGIHFHTEIPEIEKVDLLFSCSALQYVEDYRGLIRRLCMLRPRYVFLAKLPAGEVRTFATAQQNVPGSTIPYWFLDVREIVEVLASEGYTLEAKGRFAQAYDQTSLPAERRIPRMCNLLFRTR